MSNKIYMKIIIFSFFIAFSAIGNLFSQEINLNGPKAKPGTYTLYVEGTKSQIGITKETLIKIESLRDKREDKKVVLSEYLTVFIPSEQTIKSKKFSPLPEIIYPEF
jgi:hypothetical protein